MNFRSRGPWLMVLCLLAFALALPVASADVVQHGHFRVAVDAQLTPRRLPRHGKAPVRFSISAQIISTKGSTPPQLRQVQIEINKHGRLDPRSVPSCSLENIQPATTANALQACRRSLVGEGRFSAQVRLPSASPFPSSGKLLAFNGSYEGHPAILAHIYGPKPVPTSYTIPFLISASSHRPYGTTLHAALPHFSNKWGYVTGISMTLGRHNGPHSYLSAYCPAPAGISVVPFPLTHASFGFSGHQNVKTTLTRSCRAR